MNGKTANCAMRALTCAIQWQRSLCLLDRMQDLQVEIETWHDLARELFANDPRKLPTKFYDIGCGAHHDCRKSMLYKCCPATVSYVSLE